MLIASHWQKKELERIVPALLFFFLLWIPVAGPKCPDVGRIKLRMKPKQRIGDLLISYFVAIKKNGILTRKGDKMVKRKANLLIGVVMLREYCMLSLSLKLLAPRLIAKDEIPYTWDNSGVSIIFIELWVIEMLEVWNLLVFRMNEVLNSVNPRRELGSQCRLES